MGGLDDYVLRTPTRKLGQLGIGLRIRVREAQKQIAQAEAVAAAASQTPVSEEQAAQALEELEFLPTPRKPTLADIRAEREREGQKLGLGQPAPCVCSTLPADAKTECYPQSRTVARERGPSSKCCLIIYTHSILYAQILLQLRPTHLETYCRVARPISMS